jgi:endo-1,4-beta-xylanase
MITGRVRGNLGLQARRLGFESTRNAVMSFLDGIQADAVARGILYGMAFGDYNLVVPAQYQHIQQNSRIVVPEAAMKMGVVQPTQGTFNYAPGDEIALFAQKNGKVLRGHPMIWHQYQGATWIPTAIAANWKSVMQTHIQAIASRWPCEVWDVVNEAVADDAQSWRNTDWYQAAGNIGYIVEAFELARQFCPVGTKLAYCDYGLEAGSQAGDKRLRVLTILEELKKRGLVDVLACQGHLLVQSDGYRYSETGWAKFLQDVKDLGIRVDITELDVAFLSTRDSTTRDAMAAEFVGLVLQPWLEQAVGAHLVTWGVRNGISWIDQTAPYTSYPQSPLPWNSDYTPNPMNAAMRSKLQTVNPLGSRPTIQLISNGGFTRDLTDWAASDGAGWSYLTNGITGTGNGGALLTRASGADRTAYIKTNRGKRGRTYSVALNATLSGGTATLAVAKRGSTLGTDLLGSTAIATGANSVSFTWPNAPSVYPVVTMPLGTAGQTLSIDNLALTETGGTALPDWVPYYLDRAVDVLRNRAWDNGAPGTTSPLSALIANLTKTGVVSTNQPSMDVTNKLGSGFIIAMVCKVTSAGAVPSGIGSRLLEVNDNSSANRMILRWNTGAGNGVLQFDNVAAGVAGSSTTGLTAPPLNTRFGVVIAVSGSHKKIRIIGNKAASYADQEVTLTNFTIPSGLTKLLLLNRGYDAQGIWPGVVERVDVRYGATDDDLFYKVVNQIAEHVSIAEAGLVSIGEKEAFYAAGYTAWNGPWSTDPGGANVALVHPTDYEDEMSILPNAFPSHTTMRWRWPSPGAGVVAGYNHIARGNYDGSYHGDLTPRQVGNLTAFTETFDLALSGDVADATILNEFYLTGSSGANNDKKFEIAHWPHWSTSALTWFNTKTLIGTWTDPQGRSWTARNCGPNPVGAVYIVFVPSVAFYKGVIDKKAALDWLVAQGVIPNYWWINGTAIGVEPHRGSGEMRVNTYSVTFSGAGAALPTGPTNLLTNGDFAGGDTGWTGFWFSGKSIDYGNARAVFDANSVGFDGIVQSIAFQAGAYYQVEFTINRTSGGLMPRFTGGTNRNGTERTATGTYKERLLANAGNNTFVVNPGSSAFQGWVDDIKLFGPYTTATIDGA